LGITDGLLATPTVRWLRLLYATSHARLLSTSRVKAAAANNWLTFERDGRD
jgi:hypothetical protein